MDSCRAPVLDRADRCPGVLRLHEAADGWLARVRLPGGRISSSGLLTVADVAALGNGLVELTSRASLQVRGLPAGGGERAAELLGDLVPSMAHDRVRNVLASPVAGRHPASLCAVDEVVAALDRGLCGDMRLASLPGRFLFAVDDGSGMAGARLADIALVAEVLGRGAASPASPEARARDAVSRTGPEARARGAASPIAADLLGRSSASPAAPEAEARSGFAGGSPSVSFRLWLGGVPTTLTADRTEAPPLAIGAARAFLDLCAEQEIRPWRLAQIADGSARLARRFGGGLVPCPDRVPSPRLAIGTLAQPDGRAAVTVLPPLGRIHRDTVRELAALAGEVRLSTARTLTIVDVARDDVDRLTRELAALGLVTVGASGWEGLSACAGLGACARARVDVRAAAARRAEVRGPGAPAEHWSACERGCGRPAGVPVAVVAGAEGLDIEAAGAAAEDLEVETAGAAQRADDVEHALALLGGAPADAAGRLGAAP